MYEKIMDIQNTVWRIYKTLLSDHDMKRCNEACAELADRYRDDGLLSGFCQDLIITWTPIFNRVKLYK